MDTEKLEIANSLDAKIKCLEEDYTHCKIMSEKEHNYLVISSASMSFRLPISQAKTILTIAMNALWQDLEQARKEFILL